MALYERVLTDWLNKCCGNPLYRDSAVGGRRRRGCPGRRHIDISRRTPRCHQSGCRQGTPCSWRYPARTCMSAADNLDIFVNVYCREAGLPFKYHEPVQCGHRCCLWRVASASRTYGYLTSRTASPTLEAATKLYCSVTETRGRGRLAQSRCARSRTCDLPRVS